MKNEKVVDFMEYTLQNTDIFDEDLKMKFSNAIKSTLDQYIDGIVYKIEITFHVNLLKDSRIKYLDVPNKMEVLLDYQLRKIEQVLIENGIKSYNLLIKGDYLEAENIIKINVLEDISEPNLMNKGANRMKVYSIMPSAPYIRKKILEMPCDFLRKTFDEYIYTIGNEQMLAEILEIKKTSNHSELFDAFIKQYGEMWLQRRKLLEKLKEKSISIIEKKFEKK